MYAPLRPCRQGQQWCRQLRGPYSFGSGASFVAEPLFDTTADCHLRRDPKDDLDRFPRPCLLLPSLLFARETRDRVFPRPCLL